MAISIIRTLIIFLTLSIAMRLMGKRQIGEMEPIELVVAVLISDLAAHPLQDPGIPLIYGIVPVITLLFCEILISGLTMKSISLRALIYGKPSIIISNGKINQTEVKKNRITLDELMTELRKQGISDISTVKYGILETGGTLSLIEYTKFSPATPEQMEINVSDVEYQVIIINNGKTLTNNLELLGKNEQWLKKQLDLRRIKSASMVYLMTADRSGKVEIQLKNSKM